MSETYAGGYPHGDDPITMGHAEQPAPTHKGNESWWDLLRKRAALVDMMDRDLAGDTPTDKRDKCGCHRDCITFPHECETPCVWPSCLTEAESEALDAEVMRDELGR